MALHFEKSSNMPKIRQKVKKSLVQLALNPFLYGTSKTRVPGMPDPSLEWIIYNY